MEQYSWSDFIIVVGSIAVLYYGALYGWIYYDKASNAKKAIADENKGKDIDNSNISSASLLDFEENPFNKNPKNLQNIENNNIFDKTQSLNIDNPNIKPREEPQLQAIEDEAGDEVVEEEEYYGGKIEEEAILNDEEMKAFLENEEKVQDPVSLREVVTTVTEIAEIDDSPKTEKVEEDFFNDFSFVDEIETPNDFPEIKDDWTVDGTVDEEEGGTGFNFDNINKFNTEK